MIKKFNQYVSESDLDHTNPTSWNQEERELRWQPDPKAERELICKKYKIDDYKITEKGLDVYGNVEMINEGLFEIPIKFGKIHGTFNCRQNELINLENAPYEVTGNFDCSMSDLITLEGGPKKVGRNYYCSNNNLVSFEGVAEHIDGDLIAVDNSILSLDGFPKFIKGYLQIERNPISRIISMFNGIPKAVILYFINKGITLDKGEIDEEDLIRAMKELRGTTYYTEHVPYLKVLNKKEKKENEEEEIEQRYFNSKNSIGGVVSKPKRGRQVYIFKSKSFVNYLSIDPCFKYLWDGVNLTMPKSLNPKEYINVEGVVGENYFSSKNSEKTYVDFYPIKDGRPYLYPVPVYTGSLVKKEPLGNSGKKYMISYNSDKYLIKNNPENFYIFDELGEPLLKDLPTEDLYKPDIGEVGTIVSDFNDPGTKTNYVLFKSDDGGNKFVIKRTAINPVNEELDIKSDLTTKEKI